MDALGGVVGDELGGGVAWMQLDLVDSGNDLYCQLRTLDALAKDTYRGRRTVQQLLEVSNAKVGHTNVANLSPIQQLLHLSPSINKIPIPVQVGRIIRISRARPVNQVQVDIMKSKIVQARLQALADMLVPVVAQLGRHPDVLAGDARGTDPDADFSLVAVGEGRVDVAVARSEGCLDGG